MEDNTITTEETSAEVTPTTATADIASKIKGGKKKKNKQKNPMHL